MKTNRERLVLDEARNIISGSPEELRSAIRSGGDLRIYTEFRHNEHIDTSSDHDELIREVSDFPCTYLIEDRWAAGIMTLRQPVTLPDRFGERPSMSFFMYNEDGTQAVGRPYLDGAGSYPTEGELPPDPFAGRGPYRPMVRMHIESESHRDDGAAWLNFVYDFYSYKFMVNDGWEEVLSHDKDGRVLSGSSRALEEASGKGYEIRLR